MTQLTDKVYAENLPPGNYGEGLIVEVDGKYYLNLIDEQGEMLAGTKPLPPGTWRFLFTTKSATEEDAREVVGEHKTRESVRYIDYTWEYMWCDTALNSLASLLRSKNCDDQNNYALIEKLK